MSAEDQNRNGDGQILIRRSHPVRDNIEGILAALVLALIIRHFAFEVFVIPTGSMAPTLLGQHHDLTCSNCTHAFEVDSGRDGDDPRVRTAYCPNCGYEFAGSVLERTHCRCFPAQPRRLFWKGGNRVIVNKFGTHFRAPKRWDIIVFRFPRVEIRCKECGYGSEVHQSDDTDHCPLCGSGRVKTKRKNYIKRLVGLPNETLEIRHGDIYIGGEIARKPPSVQGELWQFVYDSALPIRVPQQTYPPFDFAPAWEAKAGTLRQDRNVFELTPDEKGDAMARFAKAIHHFNPYNGNRDAGAAEGMGDLRVSVRARLKGKGAVRLRISEDNTVYSAVVRYGESQFRTALAVDDRPLAESALTVDADADHEIVFSNVDDALELWVDGRRVLRHLLDVDMGRVLDETAGGGVAFGVHESEATFTNVRIERDVFYLSKDPRFLFAPRVDIPADSYYVLGDNSANSRDSRYWGFVPARNLIGNAEVVWWPLSHLRVAR